MKDLTDYDDFMNESKNKAILLSAFPGTGKSHFFRENKDKMKILDSDSSTFDKSKFPENYIKHIKENIDKADIIMISSHADVRAALVKNHLDFTLVFPTKTLKEEYIQRYKDRKSPEGFINLLEKMWDEWIDECNEQKDCNKIELKKGKYISDLVETLLN